MLHLFIYNSPVTQFTSLPLPDQNFSVILVISYLKLNVVDHSNTSFPKLDDRRVITVQKNVSQEAKMAGLISNIVSSDVNEIISDTDNELCGM